MDNMWITKKLNHELTRFFKDCLLVAVRNKGNCLLLLRHLFWQWQAGLIRREQEKKGLHVPAFAICSVTHTCNLRCKGCYSHHLHTKEPGQELSIERLERMIGEAQSLGLWLMLIGGGEPLMRSGLIALLCKYQKMMFPIFTNGLLLDEKAADEIQHAKNIIPIVSIEGDQMQTDERRGRGVYKQVKGTFARLQKRNMLFGASVTVTSENIHLVTDEAFVSELHQNGCSIVFYIEYIPCENEKLVISEAQRQLLGKRLTRLRKEYPIMLVAFPGDEALFGGCLAAGRGFVHISSSGSVEPCPFSPFSDISIENESLAKALDSKFLKAVRNNHEMLSEHEGGCALWENREWVSSLLQNEGECNEYQQVKEG